MHQEEDSVYQSGRTRGSDMHMGGRHYVRENTQLLNPLLLLLLLLLLLF